MTTSDRTNLLNVSKHYLDLLKVPITKTTLKEKLEQNPYYPSLYSLSDVFHKFGVNNMAYTITEANLNQFEPPFITYCIKQNTGRDFVLVTKFTETEVNYIAESNKPKKLSREEFLNQWRYTVFVAESNEISGEKDFSLNQKIENEKTIKQFFLYAGVVFMIGLLLYSYISKISSPFFWTAITIITIKLIGLFITIFLLVYEIVKNSSFVKNICNVGHQTNCDAVMNSKAGKLLGIGWGEIGFFYFASTTLFLLLPDVAFPEKIPLLAVIGNLAASYILFSIYYQWKVVKQWCPLCLAVQAVLTLELTWSIFYYLTTEFQDFGVKLNTFFLLSACLLFLVITWYLLKPILIASKEAPSNSASYKRLLYNPDIFKSLLLQQSSVPDGWEQLGINIGNPNATNIIIKVCNPYCGPCAKAHVVLEELVRQNRDIRVKVIFTATNSETNIANRPVKHLLAIAEKQDFQLTENALNDWYTAPEKKYEIFSAKYPIQIELTKQEIKIDGMRKWCDEAEIKATPTFFINGKRLPKTYNIHELKNIF